MLNKWLETQIGKLKLRHKLAVSYTLMFTLLAGVTFLCIYYIAEKNREDEFFQRLKDKSVTTYSILIKVEQIDHDMLQLFDRNTINSLYEEKTMIFDANDSLLYSGIDNTEISYPAKLIGHLKENQGELKMNDGKYQLFGINLSHDGKQYFVLTKAFDRYGKSKLEFLAWLLLVSFIVVTMLSVSLSFYLAKRITRPVTNLTRQIEAISTNDLSVRVKETASEDEIAFLASKFNRLLEKVEDAFKFQYHFVHHVSHELKTPLALMVANAERALTDGDIDDLKKSLHFQIDALMDVSNIIDAMLDISKTESNQSQSGTAPFRIDELLFECIEELRFVNKDAQFLFSIDESVVSSECITVNGNIQMLKMAFINLMKNAINFSASGNPRLELSCFRNQVHVRIFNDGHTLTEQEQQHLFNHLFRGGNSANIKGFGLGLVLAQRIVNLHHGRIDYSITPQKENCFHLRLAIAS